MIDFSAKDSADMNVMPLDGKGRLLLASLGVVEQLSTDGTKQFGRKRLIKLIESNQGKSNDQLIEVIKDHISDWKQDMEQTEDICIALFQA